MHLVGTSRKICIVNWFSLFSLLNQFQNTRPNGMLNWYMQNNIQIPMFNNFNVNSIIFNDYVDNMMMMWLLYNYHTTDQHNICRCVYKCTPLCRQYLYCIIAISKYTYNDVLYSYCQSIDPKLYAFNFSLWLGYRYLYVVFKGSIDIILFPI